MKNEKILLNKANKYNLIRCVSLLNLMSNILNKDKSYHIKITVFGWTISLNNKITYKGSTKKVIKYLINDFIKTNTDKGFNECKFFNSNCPTLPTAERLAMLMIIRLMKSPYINQLHLDDYIDKLLCTAIKDYESSDIIKTRTLGRINLLRNCYEPEVTKKYTSDERRNNYIYSLSSINISVSLINYYNSLGINTAPMLFKFESLSVNLGWLSNSKGDIFESNYTQTCQNLLSAFLEIGLQLDNPGHESDFIEYFPLTDTMAEIIAYLFIMRITKLNNRTKLLHPKYEDYYTHIIHNILYLTFPDWFDSKLCYLEKIEKIKDKLKDKL